MDRREALKNVAILMGGAISITTMGIITQGCNAVTTNSKELFTEEQQSIINELADTIIPPTTTPGAKAAGVGLFIALMIKDCYTDKVQKVFIDGLTDLDEKAKSKFSGSFVDVNPYQRTIILQDVVNELKQKISSEKEKTDGGKKISKATKKDPSFFQLAKELTILGYFTSEIGAKQALEYLPVPGKYEGCIDIKSNHKTWAL